MKNILIEVKIKLKKNMFYKIQLNNLNTKSK